MASIIEGYNYDIFISYRQKDNKGDRWVSEFVEYLKNELESTFKEEISVYFDIDPHDGLLETHDVDASLIDKLKCLVFIPIISRTYCDPKSFAWEHEFKAFVEQASQDQFGLKVRLPNGNVANRVLPVRIHDLDAADIKEYESISGGALRGIEFIYKEPGVNRSLTAADDKEITLNKTKYRNQINKIAIAIGEVIHSLRNIQNAPTDRNLHIDQKSVVIKEGSLREQQKGATASSKNFRRWVTTGLFVILCLAAVIGIVMVIETRKQSNGILKLEKSIAVLPFINDSPDQENAYFINGIMEEILNNLQKIKDFRVLSRTSTEQFRGIARPTIPEIAKKLDVNYIVEGSGQKYGNSFRLRVQLIAGKNEKHLWAESYEQEIKETKDIFKIQSRIAQAIAKELSITITPEEKQIIAKIPTANLTAYDFYQKGVDEISKYHWPEFNPEAVKRAETLFLKALKYDSTFAKAYSGLGSALWIKLNRDQNLTETNLRTKLVDSLLILSDIALSYDDKLAEAYVIRAVYYGYKGSSAQYKEELDKANRFNPNDAGIYNLKAHLIEDLDLIEALKNSIKAASLTHGPELPDFLRTIGYYYHLAGFPDRGNDLYLEALKLDEDSVYFSKRLVYFKAETQGDYKKAIEYYEKRYLTDSTDYEILQALGYYNSFLGRSKESLKYYEKYILVLKHSGQTNIPMDQTIGYAYLQNGYGKEAKYYFDKQIEVFSNRLKKAIGSEKITWAYKLAGVYAGIGDKRQTYENLKIFNKNPIYTSYWVTLINNDPLFNRIRNEPDFQKIVKNVESKYQAEHERVRKWLEEQGKL